MDGARRRRVAEAKRRAPHLARLGDAGVGVLRRERIETQDAIGGGALAGANLSDENESDIVGAGGARAAQHAVDVAAAAHVQADLQGQLDLASAWPSRKSKTQP